jgi:MYXO-CTERM domain-containing protein
MRASLLRLSLLGAALLTVPSFGGCASGDPLAEGEPLGEIGEELTAYCKAKVNGVGTVDVETNYLPHVVHCENGGAPYEALKAQAIAARTYLYYKLKTSGSINDGQSDQVYSCGSGPTATQIKAVKATAGQVLRYHDTTISAFFVAGAKQSPPKCKGGTNDATHTEKYVTYNEGLSGAKVHQTSLGWINPGNYANRGCMSQWGARCLDSAGKTSTGILKFYYGADIQLVTASGSCVGGDADGDGVKDASDNCPKEPNANQKDTDGDKKGDACDTDDDNDGLLDTKDNCVTTKNPGQEDTDGDKKGDACDGDDDGDGKADAKDNCPKVKNAGQTDTDKDGKGDACDTDDDADGLDDGKDNCPLAKNPSQEDTDGDGKGDVCETDDDGDGIVDAEDDCPKAANPDQEDADGDGKGDACDDDADGDTVIDTMDNCPGTPNADQEDVNEDGIGDACQEDGDGDDVPDISDNCPDVENTDQADEDGDGVGDACTDPPEEKPPVDDDRDPAGGQAALVESLPPEQPLVIPASPSEDAGCAVSPRPSGGVESLGALLLLAATAFIGRRRRRRLPDVVGSRAMTNVDDRTVAGFGDEWSRFDQKPLDAAELGELFDRYFHLFPWEELPEKAQGFDLGCGSGRWAKLVAPRVGVLHCIDASADALAVAKQNLASFPNVRFAHASVDSIPLAPDSMDFGYSLGVLHHVPDTAAGVRACVDKLKPGAPFLLYLYYAFDNRPLWFRAVWKASDVGRRVISRMPHPVRYGLSQAIAAGVYLPLARTAAGLERAGVPVETFPLSAYRRSSFYTMRTDALDRFGTRLEQRFTRAQMETMMRDAGLDRIRFSDAVPYWCAVGIKR